MTSSVRIVPTNDHANGGAGESWLFIKSPINETLYDTYKHIN